MRIERDIGITESLTIFDATMPPGKGTLDPITVILRDFGGSGQIIVECYGTAWSHWFGAIGNSSLRTFMSNVDKHYLSGKLVCSTVRSDKKRERDYVLHIAAAIIEAMKGGV
jgi:hypothetical protein